MTSRPAGFKLALNILAPTQAPTTASPTASPTTDAPTSAAPTIEMCSAEVCGTTSDGSFPCGTEGILGYVCIDGNGTVAGGTGFTNGFTTSTTCKAAHAQNNWYNYTCSGINDWLPTQAHSTITARGCTVSPAYHLFTGRGGPRL